MGRKPKTPPAGKRATWGNRVLHERAGMLRFTSRLTVAKTFGISRRKVEVHHPSSPHVHKRIFEFIERIEHDPARKWLLTHYRIWPYARIRELAPTHSTEEIRQLLLDERKTFQDAAKRLVPSVVAIRYIIRKNSLRPEGSPAIRSPHHVFQKNTRPPNRLPEEERNRLVELTVPLIYGKNQSKQFFEPELMDFVQSKINSEARRFSFPENLDEAQRAILFEKVVRIKLRNWLKDGLRTVGPYTRRGKQRRPMASSPMVEEKPSLRQSVPAEEIPPAVLKRLSPREKIVVEMLLDGAKRAEIARRLNVSSSRVSQIVQKVRGKI